MRTLAILLLLIIGLTACGENTSGESDGSKSSDDESTSQSAETCEDIWTAGETLPEDYAGCADAAGATQTPEKRRCSSEQFVYTYDDRFYAVPGAKINEADGSLKQDKAFRAAMRRCLG